MLEFQEDLAEQQSNEIKAIIDYIKSKNRLRQAKAKTLEDLKEKDLKKERLVQEVQQDQLMTRMKNAQGEYEARLAAASEPGLMDAEIEIAAYKMDQAEKRKVKAESDLQHVLPRMSVLDSTLDLLQQRAELEKKGVDGGDTVQESSELEA